MQTKATQKNIAFYNDPSINLIPPQKWETNYSLKSLIKQRLEEIAKKYSKNEIQILINKPNQAKFGDYSCNIALVIARDTKEDPLDLANKIIVDLKQDPYLKKVCSNIEAAGSGFINFFINQETYLLELKKILNLKENYGQNKSLTGKRILFEYAHPNPFKAFHIGHLRNIILGESLIRLLENCGAEVIRVNYQGDVGMHIAKCLWAFKQIDPKDYPGDVTKRVELIARCYAKGATAYEDPIKQREIKDINKLIYSKEDNKINALWELGKKWSLEKFHEIYTRVYSTFVREYMESETLDFTKQEIEKAQEKGILVKSQGAWIFSGDEYGINTRVYLTSEGQPTYEGKQLGLVVPMEFKDHGKIDLLIFNVAVEQIDYFKSTIKVIELLNPEYKGKQYHNAYEFVGLKSGKMSSRTGKVVLGEDIIDQAKLKIKDIISSRKESQKNNLETISEIVGVGAIKFSFLNISPKSYLAFDLEKSIRIEGDSGPYIQYTYARANKIVTKAHEENLTIDPERPESKILLKEVELEILRSLEQFDEVVLEAAKNLSPNLLCTYLFSLAQKYNSFYKDTPILSEEIIQTKMFRIELSKAVSDLVKRGLYLLGIKTVDSM